MKVRVGDYKYVSVCVAVWFAVCMTNGLAALAMMVCVCVCVQCGCGKFLPCSCKLFATMSKSNNARHIAACLSSIKFAERVLKFFESSLLSARNQLKASC